MSDLFAKLSAPFPPQRVSWRVGPTNQEKTKGIALAYIDARDVMERLDEVCGPAGWQCRYPHAGQKTVCELGIVVDGACLWKADGAGDSDMEAEKGALSDAFKRAAVRWGIGRYLYDVENIWVQIVAKGKSYVIAESEFPKLQKILPGSKATTAPAAAEPKSVPGITKIKADITEAVRELNACSEGEQLTAYLPSISALCLQVCRDVPNQWIGPEEFSGLKGSIERAAKELLVVEKVQKWLSKVEATARQPIAAE